MSAPRTTSIRALNQMARQIRQLHVTGASSQPRLSHSDKARVLQAKSDQEQQDFSHPFSPSTSPRYFNTSRTMKAVNDSSTIDFAYMPTFPMPSLDYDAVTLISRVPILPAYSSSTVSRDASTFFASSSPPTLQPTINTIACTSTHIHAPSAMSDVHDGAEHESTDFHDVAAIVSGGADAVREAGRKVFVGVEGLVAEEGEQIKSKGLLNGVWTGLMTDLFGPKVVKA